MNCKYFFFIFRIFDGCRMLRTPARRSLVENSILYYPFGNTRTRNILKDFKCELASSTNSTAKVNISFF